MRWSAALAFAFVLLLGSPSGSAQNTSASDPSADLDVLYAASNSADDRDVGWMNTDPDDPDNDQTSVGGAVQTCDPAVGLVCLPQTEGIDWTWTWTLNPALGSPVQLSAGTLRIVAFLGAGTGSGSGIEVTTQLKQGDAVIADGPMVEHAYEGVATGTPYQSVTWDVAIPDTLLAAGTPLVWTVHAVADTGETEGNLFMSVSDARGRSRIELPIAAAPATPATKALADGPVDIREAVANVTTGALQYSWNGTAVPYQVSYRAQGNGSVTFSIVDSANATLLQQSVDGTGNGTKAINGTAGAWSVSIRFEAFQGNVSLGIVPAPRAAQNSTTSSAGNATSESDGKGTPGLAMPALASLLLVALVARRRRKAD